MARGIPMEMGAKGAPMKKGMKEEEGAKTMTLAIEVEGPEEAALMSKASQLDDAEDEAYGATAPQGDFSVGGLNALVDGINAVLPLFGQTDYERFTEGMTALPPKFVKLLTMVNAASAAAGLDDMTIDLSDVTDDKALKMAAGKLRALGGNATFKRFLRSERPPPPEKEMAPMPGGAPTPKASDTNEDDLMMSRLS